MKFIIGALIIWGLVLIVLGLEGTVGYLHDPDASIFDANGAPRIVTGSMFILCGAGFAHRRP
jgi:hypothetical protein